MRRFWTPVTLLFSLALLLGFFQNCTPAVPFGDTDYYESLVNSSEFAYEASVDQISYMSCSEQEDIVNDGSFYTFRVGAFHSKGLRITENYRKNIYYVRKEEVPTVLTQARASSRAKVQLAVRTLDNLQLMYVDETNGESGVEGSDFDNFFPVLGDEALNNSLWYSDPNDYVRTYAAAQFVDQYRFAGELKFMKSQVMENDLRTFFGGRGVVTVTFAEDQEITPLGPGSLTNIDTVVEGASVQAANTNDLTQNVFGVALRPSFKQPLIKGGSAGPDLPPRVLSSIQDVTIDSRLQGQVNGAWTCPDSMQFMIVLPEDVTYLDESDVEQTRCRMNPDPIDPSEELKIIRQSILAEDFYVDMENHCIVPKPDHTTVGSCYGKNTNTNLTHEIEYDNYEIECGFDSTNERLCPHFASVCYRQ